MQEIGSAWHQVIVCVLPNGKEEEYPGHAILYDGLVLCISSFNWQKCIKLIQFLHFMNDWWMSCHICFDNDIYKLGSHNFYVYIVTDSKYHIIKYNYGISWFPHIWCLILESTILCCILLCCSVPFVLLDYTVFCRKNSIEGAQLCNIIDSTPKVHLIIYNGISLPFIIERLKCCCKLMGSNSSWQSLQENITFTIELRNKATKVWSSYEK